MIDIWKARVPSRQHIWFGAKPSSSPCDLGEHNCLQSSETRLRCACCHAVVHELCLQSRKLSHQCKETFTSLNEPFTPNEAIEPNRHQFEVKLTLKGKCHRCKKVRPSPQGFTKSFGGKKVCVLQCLWCKMMLHDPDCFSPEVAQQTCKVPSFVLPHTWIRRKKSNSPQRSNPHPASPCRYSVYQGGEGRCPIVLFINKKSGGGQFERLYRQSLWLLNPRQIFDLSVCGPSFGLQLFKDVHNVIFVVAGGDGTVGWILSTATEMGIIPSIRLGIIPLGTGNDLARSFNWGPGYTTEPLIDIFSDLLFCPVRRLDRWALGVSPFDQSTSGSLPTTVMHNYFSIGADARIALEFHRSRNANPEKFSSRFWNKLFYAGVGGKDIIVQSCKDLSEFCTLRCDDVDLTKKLQDKKISTLLFLNIDSYAGGRNPWGNPSTHSFLPQSCCDGWLEVIGLTYLCLLSTQLGGTGSRLCQCRKAVVTLKKDLPVQVDGEPCLLSAGDISITLLGQANILRRIHHRSCSPEVVNPGPLNHKLDLCGANSTMSNDLSPTNKDSLAVYLIATPMVVDKLPDSRNAKTRYCGVISLSHDSTICIARQLINNKMRGIRKLSNSWKFVKSSFFIF